MTFAQLYRTTMHKTNGDLLTPVLLFSRLQGTKKFLLESSAKYEKLGRYSFIGANPHKTYRGHGNELVEQSHLTGATYRYEGELIALLKQVIPRIINRTDYPFTGGAIGTIQSINGTLHAEFQVYDTLIIFDHLTEELIVIHTNIEAEAREVQFEQLLQQLLGGEHNEFGDYHFTESTVSGDYFSLYRDLRVASPAPYMFYIEQEERTVIGTAPNSFIRVHEGHVKAADVGEVAQVCKTFEQGKGELLPTAHAIDALATAVPTLSPSGAAGYIGFNGQIDFARCTTTIFIENGEVTCDDPTNFPLPKGGASCNS